MTLSFWGYYREEIDGVDDDTSNNKSFKYKTKVIGRTEVGIPQQTQPHPNPDGSLLPRHHNYQYHL